MQRPRGAPAPDRVADMTTALEIARLLREEGAQVVTFDPFVPDRSSAASLTEALENSDALVPATDHSALRSLTPDDLSGTPVRVIVDGRNCLDHDAFRAAGYAVVGIGK